MYFVCQTLLLVIMGLYLDTPRGSGSLDVHSYYRAQTKPPTVINAAANPPTASQAASRRRVRV